MSKEAKQIAVVTGAGGGFGVEIVRQLLEAGFHVAATDIDSVALESLRQSLGTHGALSTHFMDVVDIPGIHRVAEQLATTNPGVVTVLVNNAGIFDKNLCLVGDYTERAKCIIDTNLTGAINCTTVFSRVMARRKYGRIINIASIAGVWGAALASAYAASKAGLICATESWARELGPLNISVTAVAPGVCKTSMLDKHTQDMAVSWTEGEQIAASRVPIGRFGTSADVAEVVVFLATCRTNYITSAVIRLDGAMHVGSV